MCASREHPATAGGAGAVGWHWIRRGRVGVEWRRIRDAGRHVRAGEELSEATVLPISYAPFKPHYTTSGVPPGLVPAKEQEWI